MLREAVYSVINQTHKSVEIIIVLTGADEKTVASARQIAAEHPVKILETCPLNLATTRNNGLAMASGEWVSFLDDDDLWHPQKLEKQLHVAQETGAGLVTTNWQRFNLLGEREDWRAKGVLPWRGDIAKALMAGNVVSVGCLISTELIRQLGGFDASFIACEDWDMWRRLSHVCRIEYIDEFLMSVRIHPGNMSRSQWLMLKSTIIHYRKMFRDTPEHLKPELRSVPKNITFAFALAIYSVLSHYTGGRSRRAWLWLKKRPA